MLTTYLLNDEEVVVAVLERQMLATKEVAFISSGGGGGSERAAHFALLFVNSHSITHHGLLSQVKETVRFRVSSAANYSSFFFLFFFFFFFALCNRVRWKIERPMCSTAKDGLGLATVTSVLCH